MTSRLGVLVTSGASGAEGVALVPGEVRLVARSQLSMANPNEATVANSNAGTILRVTGACQSNACACVTLRGVSAADRTDCGGHSPRRNPCARWTKGVSDIVRNTTCKSMSTCHRRMPRASQSSRRCPSRRCSLRSRWGARFRRVRPRDSELDRAGARPGLVRSADRRANRDLRHRGTNWSLEYSPACWCGGVVRRGSFSRRSYSRSGC